MTPDYAKLGLRCGLEIHQQLEGRKLFSSAPGIMRDDAPHATIRRRLRAVAGETGEVDLAALGEVKKEKTYIYEYYNDTISLVELDEAPPIAMSPEALNTTLQFATMVNAHIVDCVEVMRKTVVNGSNTSGFQRTALVGRNGILKTPSGDIRIPTISIEEDAARPMDSNADTVTWRLDRLGIPLIEIGTDADIHEPQEAADVAERIGMLLRSTNKVKRGLGTIRQDVNVSIREGARVEIKGAQDLKLVPLWIENECKRQVALVEIAKLVTNLTATADFADCTSAFSDTASKLVKNAVGAGSVILGVKLPGAVGILGRETQPGKRFGTELSDAAKVASGVAGIIHSDEDLTKYSFTPKEIDVVRQAVSGGPQDAFVIVAAPRKKAEKALAAVVERFNSAKKGVLKEVRSPNSDGTTSFMRPMPGSARMYPETDIPSIPITNEMLESIEVPERIDERAARYVKLGLAKDLADLASRRDDFSIFESFVKKFKELKAAYIAEVYFTSSRAIKRQFNIDITPSESDFIVLFTALSAGTVPKEAVLDVLKEQKPVTDIIGKYTAISDADLDKALDEIIAGNPGKPFNALIGIAMAKLRGKAPGQKVNERLKAKVH